MALAIYPNPTSSSSTLDFTINANEKSNCCTLVDKKMGRVLEQSIICSLHLIITKHINHTIMGNEHLENLSSGSLYCKY